MNDLIDKADQLICDALIITEKSGEESLSNQLHSMSMECSRFLAIVPEPQ